MENKSLSTIVYVIAGIALGYISFLLNDEFLALGLVIVFLLVVAGALKKVLKVNDGFKWFLSHGGWLYLFVWFITWVIFYNL
jgi:hypothetical protein